MIRLIACTSVACLAVSCVPPKAILVEEAPAVKGTKPVAQATEEAPAVPRVVQQSGMRLPDRAIKELPETKDFVPTAQTGGNAGSVIASPPAGNKPATE